MSPASIGCIQYIIHRRVESAHPTATRAESMLHLPVSLLKAGIQKLLKGISIRHVLFLSSTAFLPRNSPRLLRRHKNKQAETSGSMLKGSNLS